MRILIAGDTHGDEKNVIHKIDAAVEHGVQRIVVLGDFGLWWGYEGVDYLDTINAKLKAANRQLFAIPGNHENHKMWDALYEVSPKSRGWAYARTHVLLAPKVLDFVWGGKQFMVAGGAVSVDKDHRLKYERETGRKIWSEDEQLTDEQVEEIVATRFNKTPEGRGGVPVDYLLTHDCSDRTPWSGRLKPDIDSKIHRQRIDRVLGAVQPKVHFHGHMHDRYDWMNRVGGDTWTQTYGLECNRDEDSWGILNLDNDEFTFATDL